MDAFFNEFKKRMNIEEVDIKQYSPLTLAFIGDSIYDCMVKFFLVHKGNRPVNILHKEVKGYVKASEQARRLDLIQDILTEKELDIVKRGRNAKSQPPKHANRSDYQKATGYECLLGYLMVSGDYERLMTCIVEGMQE